MWSEDGAAVRELQGEELQRWQASRGALEALDLSEEEAERLMKRAFGWTTQAWWRDSKVCEVPAQGQVRRQQLAMNKLCSCTVLWHALTVLWHCTSLPCLSGQSWSRTPGQLSLLTEPATFCLCAGRACACARPSRVRCALQRLRVACRWRPCWTSSRASA